MFNIYNVNNSISDDLGSFAVSGDYIVIGSGIQRETTNTCINVLETKQERYKELSGSELLKLAEELIHIDLNSLFKGPYKVAVTSLGILPNKVNTICEVFVSAIGFTPTNRILFSKSLVTKADTTWTQEVNRLTEEVYNELLSDMSLTDSDLTYFGVDFTSFNVLKLVS